ncbi:nuclease-related domain-containing protein [Levilactobacillus angrenensis]|uniref:Nuclease-related domain-containing protein n=1 Tax=Levilactobacillus angrenensis TaxID=2486020 RepID=A0ABW1U821_9LACO|nr:nuclease-related domain-containing protein [Levilactobacillus angrenensis]
MAVNYTNRGEYRTYKLLKELSNKYPEDKFHIFANLYLDSDDSRFPNRQVDHLVICRKGIFMIETKYWTGTVYHDVRLRDLLKMVGGNEAGKTLLSRLLPQEVMDQGNQSFTMCIKSPENIQVYAGDENPIRQVELSGLSLNSLIQDKLNELGIKPYIHEFVFYNYVSRAEDDQVVDPNGVLNRPYSNNYDDWGEGFTKPQHFREFYEAVHERLPHQLELKEGQVNAIARLIHRTILFD